MLSLTRALATSGTAGEALPTVFHKLDQAGIRLRRGQLAMLASAPNSGKSLLALLMAIRMNVPTLYFSADTDAHDTIIRSAAHLTGQTMDEVERGMDVAEDWYLDRLTQLDHIRFCFDPSPTVEDIDLEIRAYVEVMGELPALIVVDNLINVQCNDGDEFRGLRLVMQDLHHIARTTGSCVLVLHHVTGEFDGSAEPPPRRALHGKVSHLPELILTLAKNGEFIGLACVKNRSGPADPQAKQSIWLNADYARVSVTEGHGVG